MDVSVVTTGQSAVLDFRNDKTSAAALVSDATVSVFLIVNHVILSTTLCVTGTAANVINVCVFLRQGLRTSVDISLFALTAADLVGLATLLWLNVCSNPYVNGLDPNVIFTEVSYLTAGWPHGCASRITSMITVYVTIERSLSIAFPLKIKSIVTPRRTVVIVAWIYLINALSLVPEYSTAYFGWNFYPERNKTMLGLAFRPNRPQTKGLTFLFHGSFTLFSFFLALTFTGVLVTQLRRAQKWRQGAGSSRARDESTLTQRDTRIMLMVIMVAASLIVCFIPTVVLSITTITVTEFSLVGKEVNLFNACWSFGFLLHSVNSNVHFLLYYKMSSRFRSNFKGLFRKKTEHGSRQ